MTSTVWFLYHDVSVSETQSSGQNSKLVKLYFYTVALFFHLPFLSYVHYVPCQYFLSGGNATFMYRPTSCVKLSREDGGCSEQNAEL